MYVEVLTNAGEGLHPEKATPSVELTRFDGHLVRGRAARTGGYPAISSQLIAPNSTERRYNPIGKAVEIGVKPA